MPTDAPTAPDAEFVTVEEENETVRVAREGDWMRVRVDSRGDEEGEATGERVRVDIPIRQILQIRRGSLVELHRRPEAQVTVLANGKPIALGDIVVVDGQVGVHIVELIDPESAAAPIAPPAQVTLEERVVEAPVEGDETADDDTAAESD